MQPTTYVSNRPLIITILSGYILVQWAITIVNLVLVVIFTQITPGASAVSLTYISQQIANMILGFSLQNLSWMLWIIMAALTIGIIGYWFMQRWSVIIYSAATIALFVFLVQGVTVWNNNVIYNLLSNFLFPVTLSIVGAVYFRAMR